MKTKLLLSIVVCAFFTAISIAQENQEKSEMKYRRSSLHTILIESEDFPNKIVVLKAYNEAPFPDKYNNHNIGEKSFNPNLYVVSDEEKAVIDAKKSKAGKFLKGAMADESKETNDSDNSAYMPLIIEKYLNDKKIGRQLVSKWFNRQEDGSFNMDLIFERGVFNADFLESKVAASSARGNSILKDAGFELIKNTFVVVTKLNFVSNEPIAAGVRDALIESVKGQSPLLQKMAIKGAEKVYDKTKEGYSVWTTAYLYQLKWDEVAFGEFMTKYYFDNTNIDSSKKGSFDTSGFFQMEFVGKEKATSLVTFSLKEKRTEEQIIDLSVTRNIDKVYAKLQKKYDVFKTKTPLYTGQPITAKIGVKEGLEGGEKFEVLEQLMDPETGIIEYKRKGTITVNKKLIWDNRYNGSEVIDEEVKATTFKGGKNYYSGMLIRQLK